MKKSSQTQRETGSKKCQQLVFDPSSLTAAVGGEEGADLFFELANADVVRYRCHGGDLTISQDRNIEGKGLEEGVPQTGGIVWETAFLLSIFLVREYANEVRPGLVLEVGAGCGLLGLVLAQEWGTDVVLTDTPTATEILVKNVATNKASLKPPATATAKVLRWDVPADRSKLKLEDCPDLIVGTDVVFTERLVVPLLETMHSFAKEETKIFLCLQTRCKDAHAMLLEKSHLYFDMYDMSKSLHALPGCGKVAQEMECHLLCFQHPKDVGDRGTDLADE